MRLTVYGVRLKKKQKKKRGAPVDETAEINVWQEGVLNEKGGARASVLRVVYRQQYTYACGI
jgi:hypothetical protein